jgi:TIR domain
MKFKTTIVIAAVLLVAAATTAHGQTTALATGGGWIADYSGMECLRRSLPRSVPTGAPAPPIVPDGKRCETGPGRCFGKPAGGGIVVTAIFISHRSTDAAEARFLKDWLGRQGHQQLFLDFDSADGIPAGVDWEQRLYRELRRCQAVLIALTPAWHESMWCHIELAIAREKGKAVFVARMKPGVAGPLIPSLQEVDLTQDRDGGLIKLARGLKEHGLDPADAFDWRPARPIYPGLAAFDVDDAAIFFGRSEESWQLVEGLRRMRLQAVGAPKLLLVTGASGSGKSSLMRAGVLARLRKEPASWIVARPIRRGSDAVAALADVLAAAFPAGAQPPEGALLNRIGSIDAARELLAIARELRAALQRADATLVLAVDQAEELLEPDQDGDRGRLLELLRETLARAGSEIVAMATIRSDRLGDWQQHRSVKAMTRVEAPAGAKGIPAHDEFRFEMAPLGPMPMERISEIVRKPAKYEGLAIEDELVDAIGDEAETPDALPLLAYALRYMHDRFARSGRLTRSDYLSFGGLEGAIRNQANATLPIETLGSEDVQALKEAFVPGLVRATGDGRFSRSVALLHSLPSRAEPYLRRLVDEARLLRTERDGKGNTTIEVTHEALLRVWPTLARWIADARGLPSSRSSPGRRRIAGGGVALQCAARRQGPGVPVRLPRATDRARAAGTGSAGARTTCRPGTRPAPAPSDLVLRRCSPRDPAAGRGRDVDVLRECESTKGCS